MVTFHYKHHRIDRCLEFRFYHVKWVGERLSLVTPDLDCAAHPKLLVYRLASGHSHSQVAWVRPFVATEKSNYLLICRYESFNSSAKIGNFILSKFTEVQCDNPGAPSNGYAQGSAPYRAGDVVQFNCNPEYMMQGQPIIACQDNGRWSSVLPKCKSAATITRMGYLLQSLLLLFPFTGVQACSYPGTAIAGRMSSVKFYYSIGESITFTCDAGLELKGARMLKCLRSGKWSNAIPTCVSTEQPTNKK